MATTGNGLSVTKGMSSGSLVTTAPSTLTRVLAASFRSAVTRPMLSRSQSIRREPVPPRRLRSELERAHDRADLVMG